MKHVVNKEVSECLCMTYRVELADGHVVVCDIGTKGIEVLSIVVSHFEML